jgi:HPt (histidine-containing phosphotransfer) domain-containing protein
MSQTTQSTLAAELLSGLVVFKVAALRQLAELGEASGDDVIGELRALLVGDAPLRLEAMRAGLVASDRRATEHAAHSLKSSCAMLGGERAARLCQEIETRSRRGVTAELGQLVELLAVELPLFIGALEQYSEQRRAPG